MTTDDGWRGIWKRMGRGGSKRRGMGEEGRVQGREGAGGLGEDGEER